MADRPLVDRLPPGAVPHVPLGTLPTPVERAGALGADIGVPDLYVKRGGRTGELYGGNKVRKLEFLLADANGQGREGVWTLGGGGSNPVLATALYARQQGLTPHAAQFPQPVTEHVRENLRVSATTAPELTLVGGILGVLREILRVRAKRALARDPSLYYVPAGGSSPLGVLRFVNAGLELPRRSKQGTSPNRT